MQQGFSNIANIHFSNNTEKARYSNFSRCTKSVYINWEVILLWGNRWTEIQQTVKVLDISGKKGNDFTAQANCAHNEK